MTLAVSCLHMFAQSNWTGPPVSIHVSDLLPQALLSAQVFYHHDSLLILCRPVCCNDSTLGSFLKSSTVKKKVTLKFTNT